MIDDIFRIDFSISSDSSVIFFLCLSSFLLFDITFIRGFIDDTCISLFDGKSKLDDCNKDVDANVDGDEDEVGGESEIGNCGDADNGDGDDDDDGDGDDNGDSGGLNISDELDEV